MIAVHSLGLTSRGLGVAMVVASLWYLVRIWWPQWKQLTAQWRRERLERRMHEAWDRQMKHVLERMWSEKERP